MTEPLDEQELLLTKRIFRVTKLEEQDRLQIRDQDVPSPQHVVLQMHYTNLEGQPADSPAYLLVDRADLVALCLRLRRTC